MTVIVYDRQRALNALSDDAKLLDELVNIYVRSLPERLTGLSEALDGATQVDYSTVVRVAHNLLGSSKTVGALAIAETARAVDNAARSCDEAEVREYVARLERDMAEFLRATASASK